MVKVWQNYLEKRRLSHSAADPSTILCLAAPYSELWWYLLRPASTRLRWQARRRTELCTAPWLVWAAKWAHRRTQGPLVNCLGSIGRSCSRLYCCCWHFCGWRTLETLSRLARQSWRGRHRFLSLICRATILLPPKMIENR